MVRIVILGGGFAGVRTALNLERRLNDGVEIVLIDEKNYHLFTPSLYEVVSAYGVKRDVFEAELRKTVSIPYSSIFHSKNINFIEARINEIDLSAGQVETSGGHIFNYDYLVIALGSQANYFNISGVDDYSYPLKTMNDALAIKSKLEEISEELRKENINRPARVLIGGAGFTGIEVAAEVAYCAKDISRKHIRKENCFQVALLEAGPKILPAISDKEKQMIVRDLTRRGVIVMENSPIESVKSNCVKLKSGIEIESDLIIWTAGIKPNGFLNSVKGLSLNENGNIIVEDSLSVKGLKNVFGAGDNIVFIDQKAQRPIPALAYVAVNQGKVIAENIYRSIIGKPPKPYKPNYSVWIAPVGGKKALAHLWGFNISGFSGWVIRELVDFRYLTTILPFKEAFKLYFKSRNIFYRND